MIQRNNVFLYNNRPRLVVEINQDILFINPRTGWVTGKLKDGLDPEYIQAGSGEINIKVKDGSVTKVTWEDETDG